MYSNLEKFNLPTPESVFDLQFFAKNPVPFVTLAKDLLPGSHRPTKSHFFVTVLEQKNVVRRMYTQNIDDLEKYAGFSEELLVQAHGTFSSARCIKCKRGHPPRHYRRAICRGQTPLCVICKGYVKPDVVFFNEDLPERFHKHSAKDFSCADLLLVMGTSLAVEPVKQLIHKVPSSCHRVLINREVVAGDFFLPQKETSESIRAVFLGDCDEGCSLFAEMCGWKAELESVAKNAIAKFDEQAEIDSLDDSDAVVEVDLNRNVV